MRFNVFLIVFWLILTAGRCSYKNHCGVDKHKSINLINNSEKRVVFYFYWNYPDTLIGTYNASKAGEHSVLNKGDCFKKSAGPRGCCCWEDNFENNRNEWLYIFDYDIINSVDWELVRKTDTGMLERRLINLEYLKKNNFTIIYP